MPEERLALLYSDGSLGILSAGQPIEKAREEVQWVDDKEKNPEQFTKIVRVSFTVMEVLETPKLGQDSSSVCPTCGGGKMA